MKARIPILSEKDKKKIVAEAERELEKNWKKLRIEFGENWEKFGKIYLNLDMKK